MKPVYWRAALTGTHPGHYAASQVPCVVALGLERLEELARAQASRAVRHDCVVPVIGLVLLKLLLREDLAGYAADCALLVCAGVHHQDTLC